MTDTDIDARLRAVDATIQTKQAAVNANETTTGLLVQPVSPGGGSKTWWSNTDAMTISSVVLAFGLVVFLLATYLIKSGKDSDGVLRFFGTVLIIFLATFLVVAGYSDTQMGPVMGLLGTIAGYLLGRRQDVSPTKTETAPLPAKPL